ncbi:MAG TPA: M20 family metallopeptidase [Spirochaetales bacterium]|nr:M20 family metallopeptidase [Spirochaetales bacterium]HRY54631.1 M20 family metallopeptidase [Spirochaetia bacterium]HRZ64853.1 M20 family metallopeptidase [Spirochaetia bacterium]
MATIEARDLEARALDAVERARADILSISHRIHGRPELGGQERYAQELLCGALKAAGFSVETGCAGIPTAFVARKGKAEGVRVGFMAEYDALPDIGHGCGHNLICSSALAAGIGLGEVAAAAGGQAVVVGTPAEETDGAKVYLSREGLFDELDAALMIHPYSGNFYLTESLAMDAIELEFRGRPAHAAASPWEGLNALDAVILAFNGVGALRQQMRPDARVHGIIAEGGTAPNVIPERCVARFYVRAKRRGYLDELVGRFLDCAKAAALATGTKLSSRNYEASFDDMVNNLPLAERLRDRFLELGSGPFGRAPDSFGSIDMGNVSHRVPGVHLLVDITEGKPIPAHTPEFRDAAATPYADEALVRAGKALALAGLDAMRDRAFLERARGDFESSLGRRPPRG